jgi:hypothetical protein
MTSLQMLLSLGLSGSLIVGCGSVAVDQQEGQPSGNTMGATQNSPAQNGAAQTGAAQTGVEQPGADPADAGHDDTTDLPDTMQQDAGQGGQGGQGGQYGIGGMGACGGPAIGPSFPSTGGRGEVPAVPQNVETVDGVPLGDCHVPSADEQTQAGCPLEPPVDYDPCNPAGIACLYDVSAQDSPFEQYSLQTHFYCDDNEWSMYQTICGRACKGRFEYALDFPADCANREQIDCEERSTTTYSDPSAQAYLDEIIAAIMTECGGVLYYQYAQFEFIDGCPSHATFDHEQTPEVLACLSEKLGNAKLDCAVNLTCSNQGITPL